MKIRNFHWFAPLAIASILGVGACRVTSAPTSDPTVEALISEQAALRTQVHSQGEFLSYLATRIPPIRASPTAVPRPTPFVTGSVVIEEGRCCVGGIAGTTIEVSAAFRADSPVSPVTEMRVRAGSQPFDEEEMAEASWEPYRPEVSFPFLVPLNWVGFYVSAQFRDEMGNESAAAHDDISIEGMPALPTSTP
jgi:hypothetical protein